MGNAKKRGSFEDRKQQAVERIEKEDKLLREQLEAMKVKQEEWWNSLSDEDKAKVQEKRKNQLETMKLLNLALNITYNPNCSTIDN